MALASSAFSINKNESRGNFAKDSDQSAANTQLIVTTPVGQPRKLVAAYVAYSAAPTHAGIVLDLDNGLGAAYDAQLAVSAANARYLGVATVNPVCDGTDAFRVTAPAGGVGITSTITIITELL